ncbi:DUF551 domain-containing protein [Enterobacter hormaechei]|uniref:DUF551 domain-containing protein n=1 Tax=Enterobacter hormaechei TaxID=158836 RepID=UPI0022EFF970|nr:DUF551 domain-containing protein [Enterobacter hormaechei]MDA4776948.1 DUF551 domain-containing protein [Enterobacter hormaechei]
MSAITKERIEQLANGNNICKVTREERIELARIALASLEAEPVCVIDQSNLDYLKSGSDADVWPASRAEMGDVLLYRSATPAPVSVPDAIHSQGEKSASDDYYALGWNACRAAMLKHSEPFIVTSDHRMMEMPQVEAINAVTAMIQGVVYAETPTTMQTAPALDSSPKIAELPSGNSPVIPDGWVACSERMPDDDDFVYIWPRPDFGVELHVGQYCECHPKGDGWYAQVYEQNYGIEWCPITVTHWMPLPAAPQQEVKP